MAIVGFIGLGHMGAPMVMNLLKNNYQVLVYDISKEAVTALSEQGAIPAASIKALAQQADIVFTMLQTGEQVSGVCLGADGLFANLAKNSLYIDSSSIDVVTCRTLHLAAEERAIAMIDAPVSGGMAGAKAATLTFMVGGSDEDYARAIPILERLGKKIIHAGPAGNGQVAKICNNMILGVSMIAACEAFVLAQKLGLAPKQFFEITNNASGQCWSISKYCPMPGILENVPSNDDYKPGFAAKMMLKDLRLSQDAALHANAATPMAAEATSLYTLFVNNGFADTDFSGIIQMLEGENDSGPFKANS